jgi:pimeloyl-ACP methyl ester carboxylesterase
LPGALCLLALLLPATGAEAAKIRIKATSPAGISQSVFLTRPVHLASDRPVVFVMHGAARNAEAYRDRWHELALEHDFLLVVPEFNERLYPGEAGYELGNVFDGFGKLNPESAWAFSAVETIFDEVRQRYAMKTPRYALYGHSAGARFVQRFLYHVPDARLSRVAVANAGWYTMPAFNAAFPYGLRGSAVSSAELAAALQLPLTILLGEEDVIPEQANPAVSPEILAQGPHGFARGQAFFEAAADASARLGTSFGWQLVTVPGVGRDNSRMAAAAIPYLVAAPGQGQPLPGGPGMPPTGESLPAVLPVTGR